MVFQITVIFDVPLGHPITRVFCKKCKIAQCCGCQEHANNSINSLLLLDFRYNCKNEGLYKKKYNKIILNLLLQLLIPFEISLMTFHVKGCDYATNID